MTTDHLSATDDNRARRRVAIVPHTHWDREWYEPYQSFRLRLVDLLDRLLPLLEGDPSYARFLLDGQMAVVDDYLEVRPEAESRIRALAATGRLSMGPWYVLMDEFLVSGETIVRDLELGRARGAAFGGAMHIGYLPDMFGHIAQMPQILRLAGMEHAVVWRGVPSAINKTAFWWEAPDGSAVRAEYLVTGYGNGAAVPDDAKALVRRIDDHEKEIADFLIDDLLFMNGTDHQEPQPWLGRVVAEANAIQDDYFLEITSLAEYLATATTDDLERWKGELRSGARANVLMGVNSNRVDVKKAAARAERALEQRAEPYSALFLPAEAWPTRLFELAWREMVRNAAHDSICACSVDDVDAAVLHRFAEATEIADGLSERALKALARSFAEPGPMVVNGSHRARGGIVEVVVTGAELPEGTQALPDKPGAFGIPAGLGALTLDAATVRTILGMLPNGSQVDAHTWIQDVRVEEDDSGIDLTIAFGSEERYDVPIASIKQDLYTRLGARPDVAVRIRIDQDPVQAVLARVDDIAGFGWATCTPSAIAHPVTVQNEGGDVIIANGLVTVTLREGEATFDIDGVAGFGRLVDDGDLGDSYNFSPPPVNDVVDTPDRVSVVVGERGPLRASAVITAHYRWPEYIDGGSRRRTGEQPVEVTTTVSVHAEERAVRVTTRFRNPSRDHRLRVHLPLPSAASHSEAECAFAVVERGLEAEGRPDELGLPTFPSRRFVSAGGLTVVHQGLNEYELIDIEDGADGKKARTLALTLLRSTGMLSRLGMAYRPLPAGPLIAAEGLQLLGQKVESSYALCLGCDDPYAFVEDVFVPLEVVYAAGGGDRSPAGSVIDIGGAQVSALRRVAGQLEVRVFNPTPATTTVTLGNASGWIVDLPGRPIAAVEGSFELRPYGIATVRLPAL